MREHSRPSARRIPQQYRQLGPSRRLSDAGPESCRPSSTVSRPLLSNSVSRSSTAKHCGSGPAASSANAERKRPSIPNGCRGRRINTVAVVVRVVHPVAGHIKKPLPGNQRMPEFIHRSVGQAGAAIFRDLPQLPGRKPYLFRPESGPIPDCRSSAKPARTPYPDFSPAPHRRSD